MIPWSTVLILLIAHFIGDFILQSDKIAKNKSTSNSFLTEHTLIYTSVLLAVSISIVTPHTAQIPYVLFILINGVAHFGTDYVTSRMTVKAHKEGKRRKFFVIIGADQLIHYATIFMTYILLIA